MAGRLIGVALCALWGCALWGCGGGDLHEFETHALPVLEARCFSTACHGVAAGDSASSEEGFFVEVNRSGAVRDLAAAHAATLERVTTAAPGMSSLLREPLPSWAGGTTHAGGDLFQRRDDPAAQALIAWIESESRGGEDRDFEALEAQFVETVMPALVERCGRGGCHGPDDSAFTNFAAVPDPDSGAFAPLDAIATYKAARKHLDLWGDDASRSRLIRKAIGQFEGGLVHRGGDSTFFPEARPGHPEDAVAVQAMLEWAEAERSAVGTEPDRSPSGLLFVAGPPALREPFRIGAGPVGSDLFLSPWPVEAGEPENLTAELHPEAQAEIRDPAVSHAGDMVAFAMRRQGESHFSLWEMDLESREAHAIVVQGSSGSMVQPAYAPDGRIVAVWDGHGEVGADADGIAPELIAVDADGGVERLTHTPAPEVAPAFLATGKTAGQLLFSTRRSGPGGPEGVMFSFPLCHNPDYHGDPEYHVHFGASIAPRTPLAGRDLPDGRQVLVLLASPDVDDDRGQLALLDRSMGPALAPGAESSLGGRRAPLTVLDASSRFRDPAPLPDGRIVVAARDEGSAGPDRLWIATVRDAGDGATLESLEPLIELAGLELRSPVAVLSRPPEDGPHPVIGDPEREDGFTILRDVAVLEALYGRAAPTGARTLREDIVGLRVLAWGGALARDFARYPDGGTTVGLSGRAPAFVLDELSLPSDRSMWLELPARTPVRIQLLDARGMLVGNQLDRWYFAEGGETVPGGTNASTYRHACTGCHGSLTGDPDDAAAATPDAITSASVTLSTHRDRDPTQPLEPVRMGAPRPGLDYVHRIAPIFEQHCADAACHGGEAPAADLPLDDRAGEGRFSAAYEGLMAGAVDRERLRARSSHLIERLLGIELDAPGRVDGQCPPDGLDEESMGAVVRWIESGAFYDLEQKERRED